MTIQEVIAGATCLNITTTTSQSDLSAISQLNFGICVNVLTGVSLKHTLRLGNGNDCVSVAVGASAENIDTTGGNDYLKISGSASDISTGRGDDVVVFLPDSSASDINLGPGNDLLYLNGNTSVSDVDLASGNDAVTTVPAMLSFIDIGSLSLGSGDDKASLLNATISGKVILGDGQDSVDLANAIVKEVVGYKGVDVIGLNANTVIDHVLGTEDDDDDNFTVLCAGP